MLPTGPSRIAYYNMEIIQTLIRCLSPSASSLVQGIFNSLSARLGRAASATELSQTLNLQRHAIDICMNGFDPNKQGKIVNNSTIGSHKFATYTTSTHVTSLQTI